MNARLGRRFLRWSNALISTLRTVRNINTSSLVCEIKEYCAGPVEQSIKEELSPYFDEDYYNRHYFEDLTASSDALDHYINIGWSKGYNPSDEFSTQFYCAAYEDVMTSGLIPLLHYARIGARDGRITQSSRADLVRPDGITRYSEFEIARRFQEVSFPFRLEAARELIVVVVPPHNTVSGGILSMFTIASELKKMQAKFGAQVVIMTAPNKEGHTYCRQTNFRNSEDVYSFDLIVYCHQVSDLCIMIPEYATKNFVENCSEQIINYISSRNKVHINILNQNIELMPYAEQLQPLRKIATTIGQSVAHQSYFSQVWADTYDLPTSFLPAHISLDLYRSRPHAEKDDLILYSPDGADCKHDGLKLLSKALPSYRFVEVRGMNFETYMNLAASCKFCITFGEGLDFYFLQPIWMGGIGIAIRNKNFFSEDVFAGAPNVFDDDRHFLDKVVDFIVSLEKNSRRYNALNRRLKFEADKIYAYSYYVSQLENILSQKYDFSPKCSTAVIVN